MIPERKWGQPFDPSKLTMTAKFIIEKHQPAVASYLGFNSGYHSRQEEIEKAREEASASMAKKIATLQQQNEQAKNIREYRQRNNLNLTTGFPNFKKMALAKLHPSLGWLHLSGEHYRICFNKLIQMIDEQMKKGTYDSGLPENYDSWAFENLKELVRIPIYKKN